MKTYKPNTWYAEILLLLSESGKWLTIGDMVRKGITYKAPSRISELMRDGVVESQISEKVNRLGHPLTEYRLKPQYFASMINLDEKGMVVAVREKSILKTLF